jgi:hypothetical protein
MFQEAAPEGVLVFQTVDGGRDPVLASRVAQVLGSARVPVAVLNACQSGAVGKQLEAAVATRLLRGGAASVVAMAYSVYAVAAAEFMAAFYERLFAGETVSAAVTAGRQRLFRHPDRPSPKGDLPLADWLVPVHYLRREVRFPGLVPSRPAGAPSLEEALDQLADAGPGADGALAPVGVFTGRDGLFTSWRPRPGYRRWSSCRVRPGPARPSWPRRSAGGGKTRAEWIVRSGSSGIPSSPDWPPSA